MITITKNKRKAAIGQTTLLGFYLAKVDRMALKEVGLYTTSLEVSRSQK